MSATGDRNRLVPQRSGERRRFLPVGPHHLLVELADLETTLALFDALSRDPLAAIAEIVPAARTLMLRLHPGADHRAVATALALRDVSARAHGERRLVDIPVSYDGDDLPEVAEQLGISTDEVIRRHIAAEYVVAFTGFAPGFAYLSAPQAGLDVPRRQAPRTRIPAGSVGLAGSFSGIYPRQSPGGWQLIGTTPLVMFDPARDPAALLAPGDRVRFRRVEHRAPVPAAAARPSREPQASGLRVLAVGLPVLVEDMGRPGLAAAGISTSGAIDRGALAAANAAVGNPPGTAALEITLGAFEFEAERDMTIALAGAPAPIALRTADGHGLAPPPGRPVRLFAGDTISLGVPMRGMRSYLAVAGGLDVPPVVGSAATDTLSGIGPVPLAAGDRLGVDDRLTVGAAETSASSDPAARPPATLPGPDDVVRLDVVLGPRTDWFEPEAVRLLAAQEWRVTAESSRVGIRLAGETSLERARMDELPSEGTIRGALQVPPSGQPVLFLSDHPVTGGYPVIGSVAPHHLDLAGQIPIGARIRLVPTAPFAEIVPTMEVAP